MAIAGVVEEVAAFVGGEGVDEAADAVPERREGAFGGLAQQGLEFGEGELDRVEVGRIGRQLEQAGAGCLDGVADAGDLVRGEIVHDDDVARPQRRRQAAADVGAEDGAGHRPIDDEGGGEAAGAPCGDERRPLPMAVGHLADQPPAAAAAAPRARHVGGGGGFVDENQPLRIKPRLTGPPRAPRRGHVRPILLGGVHGFF